VPLWPADTAFVLLLDMQKLVEGLLYACDCSLNVTLQMTVPLATSWSGSWPAFAWASLAAASGYALPIDMLSGLETLLPAHNIFLSIQDSSTLSTNEDPAEHGRSPHAQRDPLHFYCTYSSSARVCETFQQQRVTSCYAAHIIMDDWAIRKCGGVQELSLGQQGFKVLEIPKKILDCKMFACSYRGRFAVTCRG